MFECYFDTYESQYKTPVLHCVALCCIRKSYVCAHKLGLYGLAAGIGNTDIRHSYE